MHTPRHPDRFVDRHIGPDTRDVMAMLQVLGRGSLDALIDATVPTAIRSKRPLDLPPGHSEHGLLSEPPMKSAHVNSIKRRSGLTLSPSSSQ